MAIRIIKKDNVAAARPPAPVVSAPVQRVLDGECRVVLDTTPNAIVAWYLMASYLYYVHDLSLLSDGLFDELAKKMLAQWDTLTHPHRDVITRSDLEAGTLMIAADAYPHTARFAAKHLVQTAWGVSIQV